MTRILRILALGAILTAYAVLTVMVLADDADAHMATPTAAQPLVWVYDGTCCQGGSVNGDCQAIPAGSVQAIPGGYQITLHPGDHVLVTKVHVFEIKEADTRKSPDGQYHACLYPTEDKLRCFYAPPMGF